MHKVCKLILAKRRNNLFLLIFLSKTKIRRAVTIQRVAADVTNG
jgi:hypothetical protein